MASPVFMRWLLVKIVKTSARFLPKAEVSLVENLSPTRSSWNMPLTILETKPLKKVQPMCMSVNIKWDVQVASMEEPPQQPRCWGLLTVAPKLLPHRHLVNSNL
jgi:hypothetical protein